MFSISDYNFYLNINQCKVSLETEYLRSSQGFQRTPGPPFHHLGSEDLEEGEKTQTAGLVSMRPSHLHECFSPRAAQV